MANSFNKAVGSLVRELRRERGLRQVDLGVALGVSYQQISKAEAGTNAIAACYFPTLASVLGVSVAELYHRVGVSNAYRAEGAA